MLENLTEKNIFIVDDSPTDIKIMKTCLKSSGLDYQLTAFSSGEVFLDYLSNNFDHIQKANPALIFVDLNMPGLDGFELIEKLHDTDGLEDLKIAVLTHSDSSADIIRAKKLKVFYCEKPTNRDEGISLFKRLVG